MNDYRTKHEPFYYCYLNKKKTFYGDRTGTTVWKIPADDLKALDWLRKQTEAIEGGQSTVWSMKRSNVNDYVHPTQKPVELVVKAITNSTKEEDIVLDQFLGSGSTLIAAEKSSRLCYGLELDPKFVDVIVQRWVDFTDGGEVIKNKQKVSWPKSQ
jgi:DNA modification methylase